MKKEDFTGQKFGKLLVLGRGEDYVSPTGQHLKRWKCQCDCGNIINMFTSQIKRGQKSCGCIPKREDLTGNIYGKLTVLYAVDDYVSPKGSRMSKWHCRCECGNETDVIGMSLKNGDCKSCGCGIFHKNEIRTKIDLTGLIFGELTVINKNPNYKQSKYHCICSCGKEIDVLQKNLTSGRKTHCGCKAIKEKQIHHVEPRNYIGETFGELKIIDELKPHITPNGSKQRIVKCKCSCGNIFDIRLSALKNRRKCSICSRKDQRVDITGKRFGKLVVLSMADDYISPSGHRLSRCNCVCDCGNVCIVNMSELVTGGTQSCGCNHNSRGLLKDHPEYVSKYDFENNKEIDFNSLTTASHKKVWWKCSKCGNSWYAVVSSQTNLKKEHGCPYCSGALAIKGKTDLASQKPEILEEWNWEKNTIKPDEITCFSGKKVWWKCKKCGHSWYAVVSNRVSGAGCPRCNIENINSFCEQATYYYIKQIFPDAINSDKHLGMELDIFIPSLNVAIEYDGDAWHNTEKKIKIDLRKNQLCVDNGIELIRIREPKCSPIENCTVFNREDSTSNLSLDIVLIDVIRYLSSSASIDVDTIRDTPTILSQFATKKYENSLSYCCPEIAKEWHPTKNGRLTPEKVYKSTNKKVWWLGKCGHEWQMDVASRTRMPIYSKDGRLRKPQGCPYCSHKRVLIGFNDLQSQFPQIAEEWHPTKNGGLKPTNFMPGSSKKVWWLCKCGHEWQMGINERTRQNQGCPICFKKKRSPSVICIETNEIFENGILASKFANLDKPSTIYKCCRGQAKTAGGYHWKYTDLS